MDLTEIKHLMYTKRMTSLDTLLQGTFTLDQPTFPRDDIILFACTAYRLRLDKPESIPPNHPSLHSAYTIIKAMQDPSKTTIDPKFLVPTQADRNLCHSVIAWLPKLTFKGLDENASGFQQKCFDISTKDHITENDFPVVAFFPKMYTENLHKNKAVNIGRHATSGYIGQVGEPIVLQINIVDKKYVDKYETWAYTAISGCNHFVTFLSKNSTYQELETYVVHGKVKRHCTNWHDKSIDETQLNYVKVKHDTLRASYIKSGNSQPTDQ